MISSGHLDWLAVTFPATLDFAFLFPAQISHRVLALSSRRHPNYKLTLSNDLGVLVYAKGEEREGTHLVYTGEVLEAVRMAGVEDRTLIQHLYEFQGVLSRLDVALDLVQGKMMRDDLVTEFVEGRAKTRARTARITKDLITPEGTLYIGAGASHQSLRVYDKGAQKHTDYAWLRLELECKRLWARQVGKAMMDTSDTRAVINRAIRDFADFPDLPEYQQAVMDRDAVIPRVPPEPRSTFTWLLDMVAPALARYQFEHPDDDIEALFLAVWRHHYHELMEHGRTARQVP